MIDTNPNDEGPRAFARFISELNDGDAHVELSAELRRLCLLLDQRAAGGKAKGELDLKLKFEIERGIIQARYEIKLKEPDKKRAGDVFFLTKGKNLTREKPKQLGLPLREVKSEIAEPVDVGGGAL